MSGVSTVFSNGETYLYNGSIVGLYNSHSIEVAMIPNEDSFSGTFQVNGHDISFKAAIILRKEDSVTVQSESFILPTIATLTNVELAFSADVSAAKMTGAITVPAYNIQLAINLERSL